MRGIHIFLIRRMLRNGWTQRLEIQFSLVSEMAYGQLLPIGCQRTIGTGQLGWRSNGLAIPIS